MKKFLTLFLSAALLLSLCACGAVGGDQTDTPNDAVIDQDDAVTDNNGDGAVDPLDGIFNPGPLLELLTQVILEVQPGSAGSSLTAANMAAKLMDWSASQEVAPTADELTAAVDIIRSMADATTFTALMELVDQQYQVLLTDDGADILESAGYESSGYPWEAADLAAYEALMAACGVR